MLSWPSFAVSFDYLFLACAKAIRKDRTDNRTSCSVVAQEQTLTLITFLPFQAEPPTQHTLSFCMCSMTLFVSSSVSQVTTTWLKTTSFMIVNPSIAESSDANCLALWCKPSINRSVPEVPRYFK